MSIENCLLQAKPVRQRDVPCILAGDVLSSGRLAASDEGACKALVLLMHDPDAGIMTRIVTENGVTAVCRAVIDNNEFQRDALLRKDAFHRLTQSVRAVVNAHDDGDVGKAAHRLKLVNCDGGLEGSISHSPRSFDYLVGAQ